jgi:hypothetical protein
MSRIGNVCFTMSPLGSLEFVTMCGSDGMPPQAGKPCMDLCFDVMSTTTVGNNATPPLAGKTDGCELAGLLTPRRLGMPTLHSGRESMVRRLAKRLI